MCSVQLLDALIRNQLKIQISAEIKGINISSYLSAVPQFCPQAFEIN